MKLPITKYGLPEVVIYPAAIIGAMISAFLLRPLVSPTWAFSIIEAILAIMLIWILAFFRDPHRTPDQQGQVIVAPADGKILHIETVSEPRIYNASTIKIAIFMNIFNVHVNRVPLPGKVLQINYKPGKYLNAATEKASRENESNEIIFQAQNKTYGKFIVKQISGAVARRIVCDAHQNDFFAGGQRFGMIKFGSRCELYLPESKQLNIAVKPGDKVKAGQTILARYTNGKE